MSYCRKHNLSPATEGMINNQINIELSASHTYLALYSFFMNDKQSFQGFAKYFKYCSEEEMIHANKFIDYQNIRGGNVTIRNIPTPQFYLFNNNKSILYQAIEFVLNLEQNVYDSLMNIHRTCNDKGLEVFLDDFINEQLENGVPLKNVLEFSINL